MEDLRLLYGFKDDKKFLWEREREREKNSEYMLCDQCDLIQNDIFVSFRHQPVKVLETYDKILTILFFILDYI